MQSRNGFRQQGRTAHASTEDAHSLLGAIGCVATTRQPRQPEIFARVQEHKIAGPMLRGFACEVEGSRRELASRRIICAAWLSYRARRPSRQAGCKDSMRAPRVQSP